MSKQCAREFYAVFVAGFEINSDRFAPSISSVPSMPKDLQLQWSHAAARTRCPQSRRTRMSGRSVPHTLCFPFEPYQTRGRICTSHSLCFVPLFFLDFVLRLLQRRHYNCCHCGKVFSRRVDHRAHEERCDLYGDRPVGDHTCWNCYATFVTLDDLRLHRDAEHTTLKGRHLIGENWLLQDPCGGTNDNLAFKGTSPYNPVDHLEQWRKDGHLDPVFEAKNEYEVT